MLISLSWMMLRSRQADAKPLARWVSHMLHNGTMAEDLDCFRDGVSFSLFVSKTMNIPLRITSSPSKRDKERNVKGALGVLNAIDIGLGKVKFNPRHILDVKPEAYHITMVMFQQWLKDILLGKGIKQVDPVYEMFRQWVNHMLSSTYQLYNFQDNLLSGKCIAGLVNAVRPDLVPDWIEWEDIGNEKKLKEAFGYAGQIGIHELVTYREMYKHPDVDSNIIYLSQFLLVPRQVDQATAGISEIKLDKKIQEKIEDTVRRSLPPEYQIQNEADRRAIYRSQSLNNAHGEPFYEYRDSDFKYMHPPQHRPHLPMPDCYNPSEYDKPRNEMRQVRFCDNSIDPEFKSTEDELTASHHQSPTSDNVQDIMDKVSVPKDVQETILCHVIKGQIHNIKQLQEGHNSTTWDVRLALPKKGFSFTTATVLKPNTSQKDMKAFFEEANQMLIMNHKNLVTCESIMHANSMTYIIMPRMNGTLRAYLTEQTCQEKEIPDDWFSTWSKDIASGMSHIVEAKFIHRSLTCGNCMLVGVHDTEGQPPIVKISGFTFSRDVVQGDYETIEKKRVECLPFQWMPPEVLNMIVNEAETYLFGQTTDLWSYGCTLWEMYSYGDVPYEYLNLTTAATILSHLKTGRDMNQPMSMPRHVYNAIVTPCWNRDPQRRPHFAELLSGLDLGRSLELLDNEMGQKFRVKCPGAPPLPPVEKVNKRKTQPPRMSRHGYEPLIPYVNVDPDITTQKVRLESAI